MTFGQGLIAAAVAIFALYLLYLWSKGIIFPGTYP